MNVKVERVEIKDARLPVQLQVRSYSLQNILQNMLDKIFSPKYSPRYSRQLDIMIFYTKYPKYSLQNMLDSWI